MTDFFEPFSSKGPEAAIKIETAQGINLAKAASATLTLKHYIWSTLANAGKISGGKYMIPHFVGKNIIDDFIKSDANLFAKTTFLWNTFYASNLVFPMFKPNFLVSCPLLDLVVQELIYHRKLPGNTSGFNQLPQPPRLRASETRTSMLDHLHSPSPNSPS